MDVAALGLLINNISVPYFVYLFSKLPPLVQCLVSFTWSVVSIKRAKVTASRSARPT